MESHSASALKASPSLQIPIFLSVEVISSSSGHNLYCIPQTLKLHSMSDLLSFWCCCYTLKPFPTINFVFALIYSESIRRISEFSPHITHSQLSQTYGMTELEVKWCCESDVKILLLDSECTSRVQFYWQRLRDILMKLPMMPTWLAVVSRHCTF